MKPRKLVMSAFGSYSERIEIDFTNQQQGIFLVTGDTGAGKTTIFDAITYALYNQTSGGERNGNMMRSHYASPETETYVELEFAYRNEIYHIHRNPDYKITKTLKNGKVKEQKVANTVELTLPDGSVFPEKKNATDAKIVEILGLSAEQFTQIVMIAQGDFLKLLYTKSDDRKMIFSKLFKTDYYWRIQDKLRQKSQELDELLAENQRALAQEQARIIYPEALVGDDEEKEYELEEIIKEIEKSEKNIQNEVTLHKKKEDDLNRQISVAEDLNKQFVKLESLRQESAVLKQQEKVQQESEQQIKLSLKADKVAVIEAKKKEKEAADKKSGELVDSLETWLEENGINFVKQEKLIQKQEESTREAVECRKKEILEIEQSLPSYDQFEKISNEERIAKKNWQLFSQEYQSMLYSMLANIESLHRKREQASQETERKREAWQQASEEASEAAMQYEQIYQAFLEEQAGILAQNLKEEQPCPVCGSLHHPKLKSLSSKAVTEQEVNKIKQKREAAERKREEGYQQYDAQKQKEQELLPKISEQENHFLREAECSYEEFLAKNENTSARIASAMTQEKVRTRKEVEEAAQLYRDLEKEKVRLQKGLSFLSKRDAEERKKTLESEIADMQQKLERARKLQEEKKEQIATKNGQKIQEEEKKKQLENEVGQLTKEFEAELKKQGFLSKDDYSNALLTEAHRQDMEQKLQEYRQNVTKLTGQEKLLEEQLAGKQQQDVTELKLQLQEEQRYLEQLDKKRMELHTAYTTDVSVFEHCKSYQEESGSLEKKNQIVKSLYQTANGRLAGSAKIDFETYVQRQYFKQIIAEANRRLLTMSNHQFMLKLKAEANAGRKSNEGLDLSVYSLITDSERDIKTLSGGESFMAALAMALGLSDIIERSAGAIHPDMMFIDEGFGSLDAQSRRQAIEVLNQLAGDNRLVGIISHVTELKEQIDHKLVVSRSDKGSKVSWEIS